MVFFGNPLSYKRTSMVHLHVKGGGSPVQWEILLRIWEATKTGNPRHPCPKTCFGDFDWSNPSEDLIRRKYIILFLAETKK